MATTGEIEAAAFNAFEAEGWERRAGAYHGFFAPITSRAIEPLASWACASQLFAEETLDEFRALVLSVRTRWEMP